MRIGLIGGAGYVGTRMIQRSTLLGDHEVIAIVRSYHALAQLSRYASPYRLGDASKPETIEAAIEGCDAVVNLTKGSHEQILPDCQVIWEACRAKGVPVFIHMSTGAVYGRADQPNLGDDTIPRPSRFDYYADGKARAEAWLRGKFGRQDGPRTVVLRPGLIWGPGSIWITRPAAALLDESLCLVNDGKGICNLIHVDNLVDGIVAIALAKGQTEGLFNVGDREVMSWREYYLALAQAMNIPNPRFHSIKESDFHEPFSSRLEIVLQHPLVVRVREIAPDGVKNFVKRLLKGNPHQARLAERMIQPTPRIEKSDWLLQTTRCKLPIAKFNQAYGHAISYLSFEEGMSRTAEWLRFAGFSGADCPAERREDGRES